MMRKAILGLGLCACLGFAVAGALGYELRSVDASADQQGHLLAALVSSLVLLFVHSWIILYLQGTTRVVSLTVQEGGLAQSLWLTARKSGRRCIGWALLAMVLVVATFLLGGAVYAGASPAWLHHSIAYFALAIQVWALVREASALAAREQVFAQLAQEVRD